MIDSPEAPVEGEVDKWGFTIKPSISDDELILMCIRNAPCGSDRKQVMNLIKIYEDKVRVERLVKIYENKIK
jgi:hypothetical protein